jgi:predicted permease
MFAIADPFVSKPLPYPSPGRLAVVSLARKALPSTLELTTSDSVPTLADWRGRFEFLSAVAPFRPTPTLMRMLDGSRVIPLQVTSATRELIRMLGLSNVECDGGGAAECLILTMQTRNRYFQNAGTLVGRTMRTAEGAPLVIAGVAPQGFVFPWPSPTHPVQALVIREAVDDVPVTTSQLLVRGHDDVRERSLESAIGAALPNPAEWDVKVESLNHYMKKFSAPTAWGALTAGGLILLVCIATTANLLFSRQLHRSGEFITRRALGASSRDLLRLIVIDIAALTLGAAGVAAVLTWLSIVWLRTTAPLQFQILGAPEVSGRVIAFILTVAISAAVVSALLSAVALRRISAGTFAQRRPQAGRTLRFFMIASQTAISLFLVITSVALGQSFANLFRQETGFAGSTVILSTSFRPRSSSEDVQAMAEEVLQKLRRTPGVYSADAILGPPMIADVRMSGCCVVAAGKTFPIGARSVTSGFFESVGTRVLSGRTLLLHDRNAAGIVVNASLAKQAWPSGSAVGEPIQLGSGTSALSGVVVGVVQDLFDSRLDRLPQPAAYRLLDAGRSCATCEIAIDFVVRPSTTAGDVGARVASAISGEQIAVIEVSTAQDRLTRSVAERVFGTIGVLMFTVVAVCVCIGGLVGVVAFVTARRTRELAIRLAVGASATHIMRTVSQDALLAAGCGIVVSLVSAAIASDLLQHVVYKVDVGLWSTGLPAATAMVFLIACSVGLTARRALRLPVSICLRQE